MARVCGIEIKSRTAHLVILEGDRSDYRIIESSPLKIELSDQELQESIKSFSNAICDFFKSYDIEKVMIKEGLSKGKFTSGASVFKIETIIQMSNAKVNLVKSPILNAFYKDLGQTIDKTSLKKYQHVAFDLAYYGLKE